MSADNRDGTLKVFRIVCTVTWVVALLFHPCRRLSIHNKDRALSNPGLIAGHGRRPFLLRCTSRVSHSRDCSSASLRRSASAHVVWQPLS